MCRRPPSFTRTATLFPYTTLFRFCQRDAAALAADRLEDAFMTEILHDLHQVILGDPVTVGDLLDGRPRFALEAEVHQDPQGVIGVDGQSHRWPSALRAAPGATRH